MNAPFLDLRISGLLRERCQVTEGRVPRIHLQLSDTPPLGWSYVFNSVWRSVLYPFKRPAGVEEGALWIECLPAEVRPVHFEALEKAVAQTNANYRFMLEQKAAAEMRQAALSCQFEAQLDELDRSFEAQPELTEEVAEPAGTRTDFLGGVISLFRRFGGLFRRFAPSA